MEDCHILDMVLVGKYKEPVHRQGKDVVTFYIRMAIFRKQDI